MAKIREVVKLHTGYTTAVNLNHEFLDPGANRARMERYMPVKSHREAFLRLSRSIDPGPKDRCFLLTGNFGTGKSHLLLMYANFLHNRADQPEVETFLKNWEAKDPGPVAHLRAQRSHKRWLVAVCDWESKDDFEEIILRAVIEACAEGRENFEGILVTHYHEAIRLLDTWKAEEDQGRSKLRLYSGFEAALSEEAPDFTMAKFRKALADHSEEAMGVFKRLHSELLSVDFRPSKANLVQILKEFTSTDAFKERYDGLVVLFDEFGYVLEHKRLSLNVWQSFAEFCNSGAARSQPCIFIAAAHRSFESYAKGWQDFAKESDRIKEIPLTAEGIEDIIGAIVNPDRESDAWASEIQPQIGVLNGFAPTCRRLGIFPWLEAPQITEKMAIGAYPMHPMSTYCLLKLASDVGSNNRTAFTFFSGGQGTEDPGSFPWFINNHEILDGNKLRLYTVDNLVDYFSREMSSSNKELREALRKIVANYETSLRSFNNLADQEIIGSDAEVEEMRRILKTVLVYQLVGLPPNLDNLAFGLFRTTPLEERALHGKLDLLRSYNVLYFNTMARTYDFQSAESRDINLLIDRYKSDADNLPSDLAEEMLEITVSRSFPDNVEINPAKKIAKLPEKEKMLAASGHNNTYSEDKRALRKFATPSQLAMTYKRSRRVHTAAGALVKDEDLDFFSNLEAELLENNDYKDSSDAVCVYVICEDQDEVDRAKAAAAKNPTDRVLVAIPRQPVPVREAMMNLRATTAIAASMDYDQFSVSDKARLSELHGDAHTAYWGAYHQLRQKYLDGRDCSWHGKNGRTLSARPNLAHDALDQVMDELYQKRNRVAHGDFNLAHNYSLDDGRSLKRNVQLKDAVDMLLATHREVEIDTSYGDDKGQIKYLRRLLHNNEVLRQTSTPRPGVLGCQVETDENRYAQKFPALADMEHQLLGLKDGDRLYIADFARTYSGAPYGLGPTSLLLFFACLIRMFGDELIMKKEDLAIGDLRVATFEKAVELLSGQFPGAYMQRRPVSEDQRLLLNKLYELFSGQPAAVHETHSVYDVMGSIDTWWAGLPDVAKIRSRYPGDENAGIVKFIEAMDTQITSDPSDFLFRQLQKVCGKSEDDMMDAGRAQEMHDCVSSIKENMEQAFDTLKMELVTDIRGVFGIEGSTYDDCRAGIAEWYNSLDENQHDVHGDWHTDESKAMIRRLGNIDSFESTLFELLAQDFKLDRVANWKVDKSTDFVTKLKGGKAHVEANATKVPNPCLSCGAGGTLEDVGGKWQVTFRGSTTLTVSSPCDGIVVLVSEAGEDPSNPRAEVSKITNSQEFRVNGGNSTLRLVSEDADGNHGKVMTVDFLDLDAIYVVKPPKQKQLPGQPVTVPLVLPPDTQALRTTLKSLVDTVITQQGVDSSSIGSVLRSIADELDGRS